MFQEMHSSPHIRRHSTTQRRVVRRLSTEMFDAVSRAEMLAGNDLLKLLGAPTPGAHTLDALADFLSELIGQPHDIFFHTARTISGAQLNIDSTAEFGSTFMLFPNPVSGILCADLNLVQGWMETLLEDEPTEVRTFQPLSARDFGLVSYILMEVVNWLCAHGLPPISVAASPPNMQHIAAQMQRHRQVSEVVYAVTTPTSAGLVRLFVPGAMARSMEIFVAQTTHLSRQRRRLMLSRLGHLPARLEVEAARTTLTHKELRILGPGDVLLLDTHGIQTLKHPDSPSAADLPDLKPGTHARAFLAAVGDDYLPCLIRPLEGGKWQVELSAATPIPSKIMRDNSGAQLTYPAGSPENPHSQERPMAAEHAQSNDPIANPAAALLEKSQVDIHIMAGAVKIPVATLAQLQSGYILELDRRLEDGVELVVDGCRVGWGELVLVEQRLGVRISALEG